MTPLNDPLKGLKCYDHIIRDPCEFFGLIQSPREESILIFHSCSSNFNQSSPMKVTNDIILCHEKHIGNTPRSIMTKGTSTRRKNSLPGYLYGNFDPGDADKLMITYRRESSHNYSMDWTCGVVYQGDMHFFGGRAWYRRQHFAIEMQRSGKLVKMMKLRDLDIDLQLPSCSSFENIVILCFTGSKEKSCYSFDQKLDDIGDSNFRHWRGGLIKYKRYLITVGGHDAPKITEIMKRNKDGTFLWSGIEQDFNDSIKKVRKGHDHTLVTIPPSDVNEEYVLLIGGHTALNNVVDWTDVVMKSIYKFNGTWFHFGQLKKPRAKHNSIHWNGAVYNIGGIHGYYNEDDRRTKMEIWKIEDSPDQFKTYENWPELYKWEYPHLFIVPDSFFPA